MVTVVIMIVTCTRNHHRLQRVRRLWVDAIGLPYVALTAGTTAVLDLMGHSLVVPCGDHYDDLSCKVVQGIQTLAGALGPDVAILKVDDDMLVRPPALRAFLRAVVNDGDEYTGVTVHGGGGFSTYHRGKCRDPVLNASSVAMPNVAYCRGPMYYLGPRCHAFF